MWKGHQEKSGCQKKSKDSGEKRRNPGSNHQTKNEKVLKKVPRIPQCITNLSQKRDLTKKNIGPDLFLEPAVELIQGSGASYRGPSVAVERCAFDDFEGPLKVHRHFLPLKQ